MTISKELLKLMRTNPDDTRIQGLINALPDEASRTEARATLAAFKKNKKAVGKADDSLAGLDKQLGNAGAALVRFQGGLNDVTKAIFGGQGSFYNVLNDTVDTIEKYRIQLNKLAVDDSRAFMLSLRRQGDALRDYGVTYKTLIQVTEGFRVNLNELTSRTYAQNANQLRAVAAVNERFGIVVGESVDFLNNLNKGFNISGRGADRFSRTLLNFARQTGQPFSKVFRDFNSSISEFFVTLDSRKALERFTVFQQASRTLGTSVNQLLGVVDKFDTLEGGFEMGGQLNMLLSNLGGTFDAQRAILMTRPERLRYLAETIAGVGGQIRGMSELGQRAIIRQLSQTTGFDVGTIRQFIDKGIGGDIDTLLQKSQSLTAMTAQEQKRLADENTTRAEKNQQVSDRLINKNTLALENFAQGTARVLTDLQQMGIDKFAEKINPVLDKLGNQVNSLRDQIKSGLNITVTGTIKGENVTLRGRGAVR
jgi:hypothetical protein